jgi:hypothetical protein
MPAKVHVTDPFLQWMRTASVDRETTEEKIPDSKS